MDKALTIWLRAEGLAVLVVSCWLYADLGFSGWTFALCFLLPDVAFAGYFAGPRLGALAYNLAHSYVGALTILAVGLMTSGAVWLCAGLIWTAHIGFDRVLGYGLKSSTGFKETHLGRIGGDSAG